LVLNILMIDDDHGDARMVERYLEEIESEWSVRFNHVNLHENVHELLRDDDYHVVFLDFEMGAKNGLDVLRTIRDDDYRRPVVMLTGKGNERIAAEAFRHEANDYLAKEDLSAEELKRSITFVLQDFFDTQTNQQQDEIKWIGRHDALTGFFNQNGLVKAIEQEIVEQDIACLLLLGLKRIDRVNETKGREAGNTIIKETSRIIEQVMDEEVITGRPQGTDFCVVIPNGRSRAREVGESIRKRFQNNHGEFVTGNTIPIDLVIEVFEKPTSSGRYDVKKWLDDSIQALYKQKLNA